MFPMLYHTNLKHQFIISDESYIAETEIEKAHE